VDISVTGISSWYFSWTSSNPHRSGFKFHIAVISVLCVIIIIIVIVIVIVIVIIWECYVARMEDKRGAYRVLGGETIGKESTCKISAEVERQY
jgi:heme/copper-type cytochrome/quinol oxidase subunit 2